MARDPFFTVVERFGPVDEARWMKYVEWSGLGQLRELVSLDTGLCPPVIQELIAEDWDHNVQEDYRIFLFRDLPYLLGRVPGAARHNILAVLPDPREEDLEAAPDGFELAGFEVLDVHGDVSALSNCAGFAEAFDPTELNAVGLLDTLERANEVRASLRREYPEEPHAACDVWAVWRREPPS